MRVVDIFDAAIRPVVDQTTITTIAQARVDLARHCRNDREFRNEVSRARRGVKESQELLRQIDAALARLRGRYAAAN